MEQREKLFVVINLGSSYISAMLASKQERKIQPIATYRESSTSSIIHGGIHNIGESTRIIAGLIDKISQDLTLRNRRLTSVYLGVESRSMKAIAHTIQLTLSPEGEVIGEEHLQSLRDKIRSFSIPGMKVLRIVSPRYSVDGRHESNPKGVRAHTLEATYQLIVIRQNLAENIQEVISKTLNLKIMDYLITPLAEAEISLSREEMALGVAYVNIGGGTTSVAVYHERSLETFYVLPMGGINVTKDLASPLSSLHLIESDAESLKLSKGSMNLDIDRAHSVQSVSVTSSTGSKTIKLIDVNRIIAARMNEIITNVLHVISQSGCQEKTRLGLVLAGGATQTDYLLQTLERQEIPARMARIRRDLLVVEGSEIDAYADSLIALAYQASEDCTEEETQTLSDFFDDKTAPPSTLPSEQEDTHIDEGFDLSDPQSESSQWVDPEVDNLVEDEDVTYNEGDNRRKTSSKTYATPWFRKAWGGLTNFFETINGTDNDND